MVAGKSAEGLCGAGGRAGKGWARCTGRRRGRDGLAKSRDVGGGGGCTTGGTENSNMGSIGTCAGGGVEGPAGSGAC